VIPSIQAAAVDQNVLVADLQGLAQVRERSRDELIGFTHPFLVRMGRRVHAGMRESTTVDIDDLVQESWPAVLRHIDLFASPRRPAIKWAHAIKRNVCRDMNRVEHKLLGVSEQVWQIRRWLDQHPDAQDPEEVALRMGIERQQRGKQLSLGSFGRDQTRQSGGSGAQPFISHELVSQALGIPNIVRLHNLGAA
jgi:DNA-directed RNA polymerase specialized sigma24 family protein